jgi:hypothetical protein
LNLRSGSSLDNHYRGECGWGLRSRNRRCGGCGRRNRALDLNNRLFNRARLALHGRSGHRRFDDHDDRGLRHYDCRARRCDCACRSLRDHRADRRTGSDGRWRRRSGDDRGSRSRLWNDSARLRAGCRRRCDGHNWGRRRWPGNGRLHHRRMHRRMTPPSRFFLFPLLGLYGLQHVAGLGDMRKIDLGCNALRGARRGCARLAG